MTLIKLTLSILLLGSLANARTKVSFDREIEVSDRPAITWGDLATVQGGDDGLLRELSQIEWQGGGADEIRRTLRESRPFGGDVQLSIPQEIRLRKVSGYSKAEFRRKLMNYASARCGDCRIEVRSVRDDSVKMTSNWTMDESTVKPTGSLLVPVTSEGGMSAWIPVQMKVFRSAMVLKRSVPLGQRIAVEDTELKESEVSFSKETPIVLSQDLDGVMAARSLSAGHVIFPSDLKKLDAVKRGQALKLLTGTDDFEVMVSVTAEENGRIGDMVKVKNPDSGKSFSAVVTAPGLVRLQ